eukprot:m51a1_g10670 hypothetical protein (804) ;mRNA; r:17245-22548
MPTSGFTDYAIPISLLSLVCQLVVLFMVMWHKGISESTGDLPNLHWFLVPCSILGIMFSDSGRFFTMMGTGSVFLEAVALVPQLLLILRMACKIDGIMLLYIVSLAVYKGLYTTGWLYEFLIRNKDINPVVLFCDILQSAIFLVFFTLYLGSVCASAFDLSTRARLVSGVPDHFEVSGEPGTLVLYAPNAVSIAGDDYNRSVAAAATYEKSYFGLVSNCIGWMKTGNSSLVCSLNGVDTPAQRDAVTAAGCTSTTSGGFTQSALSGVDILFVRSEDLDDNGTHTSQNIEAVRTFVRNGGSLVISGTGWTWTFYRNRLLSTHPANLLLAPCGLAMGDGRASVWNGAAVQQNDAFSENTTNVWYVLETIKNWLFLDEVRFAGLLYIVVTAKGSPIEVQFSGKLSDAPVYRSGITSAAQWNSDVSSTSSPWGEVETKDVVFTLPTASLKKVKNMTMVADYWQRVMDCIYHFRTTDPEAFKQRYVADVPNNDWYMHAGYPIVMWVDTADETLMTTPQWSHWGQYHECGHNMQSPMWTFDGTLEVTNNMWSLYCERTMTGNWNWQADNLKSAQLRGVEYQKHPDFNVWKKDPFMALQLYISIGERWGWDTFMDLFREYDALPENQRPWVDNDKRDQWLIRTSKRINHNLCQLFDMWGIPVSNSARRQVAGLPAYSALESLVVQGHVSLRSYFGTYVSAQDDGTLQVNSTMVKAWEAFNIIPSTDKADAVVIRSAHGKYLSVNPSTHQATCNADKPGDWETFFPLPRGGSQWRFRAANGKFLETIDSPRVLVTYNTEPADWETFTVQHI